MIDFLVLVLKESLHFRELKDGGKLLIKKHKNQNEKEASLSFLVMSLLWFLVFFLWLCGLLLPLYWFEDALRRLGLPITFTIAYSLLVLVIKYTIGYKWKKYYRRQDPFISR